MATDDDDDDDDDVEDVKGGRAEGGMRRGGGNRWERVEVWGERKTLSQQRRCVIFTLAHTKLVHNNCATCHGRHDRDCTIESGLARNNCQLFSQSKQQQLRAASTTNYVGPTATAVGWPLKICFTKPSMSSVLSSHM